MLLNDVIEDRVLVVLARAVADAEGEFANDSDDNAVFLSGKGCTPCGRVEPITIISKLTAEVA
jgi:hypothetical protein